MELRDQAAELLDVADRHVRNVEQDVAGLDPRRARRPGRRFDDDSAGDLQTLPLIGRQVGNHQSERIRLLRRRCRTRRENWALTEQNSQSKGQPHWVMTGLVRMRSWPSMSDRSGFGSSSNSCWLRRGRSGL